MPGSILISSVIQAAPNDIKNFFDEEDIIQ